MKSPFKFKALAGSMAISALLASPLAVAATIHSDQLGGFYQPDLVQYVISRGDVQTVVIANPFGNQSDAALVSSLHLPGHFPPSRLKVTAPQSRDDGHLVLVFNPMTTTNGDDVCAEPAEQAATGSAPTGTLRLQAAFCYDDEMVSEAVMEMPRPASMTDRAFNDAMDQLLAVLLPSDARDRGGCVAPGASLC